MQLIHILPLVKLGSLSQCGNKIKRYREKNIECTLK